MKISQSKKYLSSQRIHKDIVLALDTFSMAQYRAIKEVSICADWVDAHFLDYEIFHAFVTDSIVVFMSRDPS
jgi:hypothetical protein